MNVISELFACIEYNALEFLSNKTLENPLQIVNIFELPYSITLCTFNTVSSIACQSSLLRDKEQRSVLYELPTRKGKLS